MEAPRPRAPYLTYALLSGAAALLTLTAAVLPRHRQAPPPPPQRPVSPALVPLPRAQQGPQVDVVFVLDTTGSMSGLLEGAKRKIWEIARYIAQGQPTPDLRVGLVAYRDLGDDYVTKVFDLTDDLDAVYQDLSAFNAAGGGDTPEHVARALHDAVYRVAWSPGKNTLRIIYLVGDAPPHTDYKDGYDYRAIAQQAGERGIRVNTIRCGQDPDTERTWREIAARAHGEFATIDQAGGVVDVHTPYDDELARLNGQLFATALAYGPAERRRVVYEKARAAAAAPAGVQADRAGFFSFAHAKKGKPTAVSGGGDLLGDMAEHKVRLEGVARDDLPEDMQGMSEAERQRYVAEKAREREQVLARISALSAQRDAFLRDKKPAADTGFDGEVRRALKKQAADVGLAF